jgi:hypothetical protein
MENIIDILQEITSEGGDNNHFIIHLNDDYYIQFTGQKGNPDVYCEAVSNLFLEEKVKLTEAKEQQMLDLGWSQDMNYSKEAILNTAADFVKLGEWVQKTATEVYGIKITEDTELTIEVEG